MAGSSRGWDLFIDDGAVANPQIIGLAVVGRLAGVDAGGYCKRAD
jgi:hypothetical protein